MDSVPLSQLPCVNHLSALCLVCPACNTGMQSSKMCASLLCEEVRSQKAMKLIVKQGLEAVGKGFPGC